MNKNFNKILRIENIHPNLEIKKISCVKNN